MVKSKRIIVFSDVHAPFHDPRYIDSGANGLILDIAEDLNVDQIIINGDLLDFYNLNMHGPKHPDIVSKLEDEVYWSVDFFKALRRRFPKKEILFIFGNHENRLDRWIVKHAKAFHNFFKLERMLQLEENNIDWIPYNSAYQINDLPLYIQHSPPSYSENAAMTSLKKKMDATFIYGCTHRMDFACKTGASGNAIEAYCLGWLGSTTLSEEHAQVFSYAKNHQNWQNGFVTIDIYGDDFFVNQHMIKNYRTSVNGFIYEA